MWRVDAAREAILGTVRPLPEVPVELDEALGLVLAQSVVAGESMPPFSNAAMDGFAVRTVDLLEVREGRSVVLPVVAEQPAGSGSSLVLEPGTAVRIMTGAPLPAGTDAVIPVEHVAATSAQIEVTRPVAAGSNLRFTGEDVKAGEQVLDRGQVLRPAEIGLLAGLGQARVLVHPAPRVAVMTTGNELVHVSQPLGSGQIRDANVHALSAMVRAAGGLAMPVPRIKDDPAVLEAALLRAWDHADVILTNGGVSMGDHDHIKPVLDRLGAERVFWQVAQKPGRPMTFSLWRGKPVFGLPGNPVAAQICFEVYVRPALRRMMGHTKLYRPEVMALLDQPLRKGDRDTRVHFLRVRAQQRDGRWHVALTGAQGSGLLRSMVLANGLVVLSEATVDPQAGSEVVLWIMDQPEDH